MEGAYSKFVFVYFKSAHMSKHINVVVKQYSWEKKDKNGMWEEEGQPCDVILEQNYQKMIKKFLTFH